ncbi:DUF881 domain-containing protein [Caldibacillus debilis]|uniref:DUF881 domain-containing protein n=1 Tax=Caldibacillus debilis TaxID=301148 RepID=UPI0023F312D9|nr:DUF881 domain-containing protein [Caldibacillus debilis]
MARQVKTNRVVFSLVCLVLGFLVAYSYQLTQREEKPAPLTDSQWKKTVELRNELIAEEKKNRELAEELHKKQNEVLQFEKKLADEEKVLSGMAEEAEQLRRYLGKVKVSGKGLIVTLDDGKYPYEGDVNNYIVHEHHIFKVVNELYLSGAYAVAINGQRLTRRSYIVCNGPVITVDGKQFPAPFVITALGDPDVLEKALNMRGGVKDQLVSENIVVKIEKSNSVEMEPILGDHPS